MQKIKEFALRAMSATAVCSAFGFLARWMQNINIFDENTGLAAPGAVTSWMLVLFTLAFAVGMGIYLLPTLGYGLSSRPAGDIRGDGKIYVTITMAVGAVFCLAGAAIFIGAGDILDKVLGLLAIFSGFGFICVGRGGRDKADDPLCSFGTIVPVLFCCFWLVVCYKNNSADPVVWHYAIEVLAIAAAAVALYFVAGFVFCRPRLYHSALSCAVGAYLCFACLGDERSMIYQAIFAALGLFFTISVYQLLANLQPENKRFTHLKEEE